MRFVILILCLVISNVTLATPTTFGYGLSIPNRFWPYITTAIPAPNGSTQIFQNTAANNPDVFCESQGSGYRLPSTGELTGQAQSVSKPGLAYITPNAAHWSGYIDNDITKSLRGAVSTRAVSGNLWNEWGNVTSYSNWGKYLYWATEIVSANSCGYPSSCPQWGRASVDFNSGGYYGGSSANSTWAPYQPGLSYAVSCVRDLVPTPSTPSPGKNI